MLACLLILSTPTAVKQMSDATWEQVFLNLTFQWSARILSLFSAIVYEMRNLSLKLIYLDNQPVSSSIIWLRQHKLYNHIILSIYNDWPTAFSEHVKVHISVLVVMNKYIGK